MIKKNAELSFMMMFVFIVMNFLMSMSSTLFNGILDKIAIAMNISVAQTGYLSSLYAYGAIGTPLFLMLCRKISHSVLLKATLLSNIFFGILSILAANFPLLLFSRFMLGMFGTAYGVLATTSIVFLSKSDRVGKNLSLLITGSATALMIGLPICRILINHYTWQSIYFILILLMILGLIYFMIFLPEVKVKNSNQNLKTELKLLKNKKVLTVIICSLVTFIGYGAFYTYITPYIVEIFPALEPVMGGILVLIGLCSFLGNLLGGVICDQIGFKKALWLGSLAQVIIGFVIWFSKSSMYLNLIFIFLWMMTGWFIGLQLNTGINIVTNRQSSVLVSINGSIIQFAQALGGSIASLIISTFGIAWNISSSIVDSLLVIFILMILKDNHE